MDPQIQRAVFVALVNEQLGAAEEEDVLTC